MQTRVAADQGTCSGSSGRGTAYRPMMCNRTRDETSRTAHRGVRSAPGTCTSAPARPAPRYSSCPKRNSQGSTWARTPAVGKPGEAADYFPDTRPPDHVVVENPMVSDKTPEEAVIRGEFTAEVERTVR